MCCSVNQSFLLWVVGVNLAHFHDLIGKIAVFVFYKKWAAAGSARIFNYAANADGPFQNFQNFLFIYRSVFYKKFLGNKLGSVFQNFFRPGGQV